MIYGVNFGAPEIPVGVKRKFAETRQFPEHGRLALKGVATSKAECDIMLVQASNGKRILRVVERKTAAGLWYGIYVG